MRMSLLGILRCPGCGGTLSCVGAQADAEGAVRTGTLRCDACGSEHPIVDGIPRFVPRSNYAASFGYQWNRFSTDLLDRWNGTSLSERRLLAETGTDGAWWSGKRVLEVGCGSGRFVDVASRLGAEIVAVDYSSAVDAVARNLGTDPNVHVVQADVYALPFAPGVFDACYSIGVIQHTPDPWRAVRALPGPVRPGGLIAVTCYERRPATMLNGKYVARRLLRGVGDRTKMRLIDAAMPFLFSVTDVLFRLPVLGRALRFAIPVANYVDLQELSRAQRYRWALLDTFDMLAPAYDIPQTEAAVASALASGGAVGLRRLPNPGLNVVGQKGN